MIMIIMMMMMNNIRISTRRGTLPRPRHLAQPGAANLGMDQAALENALQVRLT